MRHMEVASVHCQKKKSMLYIIWIIFVVWLALSIMNSELEWYMNAGIYHKIAWASILLLILPIGKVSNVCLVTWNTIAVLMKR